ncbi:DUF2911 domain-containing protein [Mucilaginibacter hurinus]|uniref:DUF2911 domain-containing protein n=1 Tax=Mucilaginibacter hurinus TaxID=2201324 RepID=A0A367GUT7_9SPHI|nr:DUF2911 domain-containing protein [Mucilaginibacter hurinus]RCH56586.1 DUF2911 domain-containing protein [Mucilaginibacter hurinus]
MKKAFQLKSLSFMILALLISGVASAQTDPKPLASPRDSVTAKAGSATITINYGSPSVKGRKIWGSLVPYSQVWRSGANMATTFTTDKDITVEGKKLAAGTYSFFTIPTEGDWTIIFNKIAVQPGSYKYDVAQDALRATVKPVKSAEKHERLVYKINTDGFTLNWDDVTIPVSIK